MSAFIGPIHYWLYGKIKLVSQREEYIFNKAYEMCASTAEELREQVWQTYGAPLADAELGELIDHDNIHGWLQRQIKIVESREAAFIKELLDACGSETRELIEQAFFEHGKKTGEIAQLEGKYEVNTATGIYKALNDYNLSGMPCDQGDKLVVTKADSVIWEGACLQEANWKRAGANTKIMLELYQSWFKAFVGGMNKEFCFRQIEPSDEGAIRYEIYKED